MKNDDAGEGAGFVGDRHVIVKRLVPQPSRSDQNVLVRLLGHNDLDYEAVAARDQRAHPAVDLIV